MANETDAIQHLRRTVEGVERIVEAGHLDEIPQEIWDEYVAAREFLGVPIEMFPGGYDGGHFHFTTFDPKTDTCASCEDAEEDAQ